MTEMNLEQRADTLIENMSEVKELKAKGRRLRKTTRKDTWIYEIGERGVLIRYFVRRAKGTLRVRRVITKFTDENYTI